MKVRFDPAAPYEVEEGDVPFARPEGKDLEARVYRPKGEPVAPLAALVDVRPDVGDGRPARAMGGELPGLGRFFAVLMVHEIGDVRRFATLEKLSAYAGSRPLDPRIRWQGVSRSPHEARQQVAAMGSGRSSASRHAD